jgi:hypothetical protein
MKKQFLIIISALIYLISCNSENKTRSIESETKDDVQEIINVDTNNISIIKLDSSNNWLHIFENQQTTSLSQNELVDIEQILLKCLREYNVNQKKEFEKLNKEHPEWNLKVSDFTIELSGYRRQYYAILNEKKEKEVWINCFCSNQNPDWKKDNSPVLVLDGGNCYFNLKINLTTKKYYDLMVNGNA